ncbi:cytochrome P450, partial [Mytilinidion resinicola]
YQRFLHPLSKVPGPFLASITPLWLVYHSRALHRHRLEIDLHKTYGPIVRLSPNEVSLSDPKNIKLVYGASSPFVKSRWYETIASKDPEGMNLLGESDMKKYHAQRRLIGPAFTTESVKRREFLLDKPMGKFVAKMKEGGGRPVDLVKWMNILALDLLTEITFAESMDYISTGDDRDNAKDIDIFWQKVQWVGLVPDMWRGYTWAAEKLRNIGLPLLSEPTTHNLNIIKFYIAQLTSRAKSATTTSATHADIASDIARFAASHPNFKPQWAATTIVHIIAAGFDTLGMTLSACFGHIGRSPTSQAKLHAELDNALKEGQLDDAPSYEQVANLPYLHSCLTEAMRLTTVIGVSLPRVVPGSGAVVEGHELPAGTVIGANPWVVHRDKGIYGEDAEEFRPERYLEASKERRYEMDAHSLAFGGPSRSCPGRYLAWVTLTKTVAAIFLHFEIEVLEEAEAKSKC